MNDHDAMEAINKILDEYFRLEHTAVEALHQIAQISGANQHEHNQ